MKEGRRVALERHVAELMAAVDARYVGATLASVAALVVWIATPFSPGGDAFAVYFPVVWGWADGEGLRALLHLEDGVFRAPGYPLALAISSAGGANLTFGVITITLASAAGLGWVVAREQGGWTAVAVLGFVGARPFVSAATDVTPDLLGTVALTASATWAARDSKWSACLSGVLLGAAVLTRFNFVSVAPCIIAYVVLARPSGHACATVTAFGVVLAVWSVAGLALGRGPFWIPAGPPPLGEPQVFGGLTSVEALVSNPAAAMRVVTERFWTTVEACGTFAGPFLVTMAVFELVARTVLRWRTVIYPLGLVTLSLLPLVFVRPEERYYLFTTVQLALLATYGLKRVAAKSVPAAVAVGLVLGGFAAADVLDYGRFRYERFEVAADIVGQARRVARRIGVTDEVVAERLAYELSPLRFARRPLRTRCCEPDERTEVFVRLRRRGHVLPTPVGFREEELEERSFFRMFVRDRGVTPDPAPALGSSPPPPR